MQKTDIEWTDYSSNPLRAVDRETGERGWWCSHVSPGCEHCYAETLNRRFGNGVPYHAQDAARIEWVLDERELKAWQRLQPGERVFVCDMTDLFHETVPDDEIIAPIFAAMLRSAATFQVLTKRPARMREFVNRRWYGILPARVWLGTSVEDQQRAEERIPILRDCFARTRFLSVEPLLAPAPLRRSLLDGIDWVICGGESGGGARPCNVEWVRQVLRDCYAAGVPAFVKQLGKWVGGPADGFCPARWLLDGGTVYVPPLLISHDRGRPLNAVAFGLNCAKGGEPREWPDDLRIRMFPEGPP